MNWKELACYAAGGALAGLVGWLVARRIPRQRDILRVGIPSVLVALSMVVVGNFVVPPIRAKTLAREFDASAMELFGDPALAALYTERLLPLVKNPHLQQRVRDAAASAGLPPGTEKAGLTALTYVGMARLSPPELEVSFALRRRLAEASRPICIGLWKGGVSPADLTAAVRSLSLPDKRIWIDLTTRAAELELQATAPPPRLSNASVTGAWVSLMSRLSPADQQLFDRVSKAGAAVTNDDACHAFQVLTLNVNQLPAAERDTLIRSVTCPFLVSADEQPAAGTASASASGNGTNNAAN
jgi:hypothetical protein